MTTPQCAAAPLSRLSTRDRQRVIVNRRGHEHRSVERDLGSSTDRLRNCLQHDARAEAVANEGYLRRGEGAAPEEVREELACGFGMDEGGEPVPPEEPVAGPEDCDKDVRRRDRHAQTAQGFVFLR